MNWCCTSNPISMTLALGRYISENLRIYPFKMDKSVINGLLEASRIDDKILENAVVNTNDSSEMRGKSSS